MYTFSKRGPLWLPEEERVKRYFPKDLPRYKRYRDRFKCPIAFVKKASNTNTSGGTITADLGSNPASGNILIACYASNDGTATVPAGWTKYEVYNGNEDDLGFIAHKISNGSEQTVTVTDTGGTNTKLLSYSEFSGIDTSSPLDQQNQTTRGTGVTSKATGNITTTVADELIIVIVYVRDATVSAGSWGTATLLHSLDNGSSFAMYCGYRIVSSTGTYSDTASWTSAGTALGGLESFKIAAAGGSTFVPLTGPSGKTGMSLAGRGGGLAG